MSTKNVVSSAATKLINFIARQEGIGHFDLKIYFFIKLYNCSTVKLSTQKMLGIQASLAIEQNNYTKSPKR